MNEKISLLIVDDDPDVLKSFQLWLKNEGFRVFTASDGKQAVEIIKKQNIAACLVDLRLKNEDGLRISAELKSLDERLRILILTGYPTYEGAVEAMKTGMFDYLSKSTDNEAILRKIHGAVEERASEIARDAVNAEDRSAIVLIGHHVLVKEGLENFIKDNKEYCLRHTYPSCAYVKKSDFSLDTALLLICASCNEEFLKTPKKTLGTMKAVFPNANIVIINCECDDEKKRELIHWGVRGFFPASIGKAQLKKALDCLRDGQIWISRTLAQRMLTELLEDTKPEFVYKKPLSTFDLTDREIEILQALAAGLSNFAISEKLFLSEKTVKTHTHHIFRKMKVNSRTQAVMKALEHHII
jgi:DNA-binding NarL/FixJ family response regulator